MVHDGLTNPFTGKQMFDEATEIGDELEITREPRPLGAALARARDRGERRGASSARRSSPIRRAATRSTRATARDTTLETLAKLPGLRQGGQPHGRQLAGRQRRRRRARALLRRVGRGQRQGGARRDRRPRAVGQRLRLPRTHARRSAAKKALEKAGPDAATSTAGDQRGVRLGRRSTRSACSASTRRRSTSTAAPSRSATRSAPPARASSATLVHELRRRGGGLGCAAICSGGGQGDAMLIEV